MTLAASMIPLLAFGPNELGPCSLTGSLPTSTRSELALDLRWCRGAERFGWNRVKQSQAAAGLGDGLRAPFRRERRLLSRISPQVERASSRRVDHDLHAI